MSSDLHLSSYLYDLPEDRIASHPVHPRDQSKLLVFDRSTDEVTHTNFYELPNLLPKNSTIIFNQSRVTPCRLNLFKESGGKAELFVLSPVAKDGFYSCLIKTSRKKKIGDRYLLPSGKFATIKSQGEEGTFWIAFDEDLHTLLENFGIVPIPPYIRGGVSQASDKEDYQTIYAKEEGSVAAPTAGLHFTDSVFKNLDAMNIKRGFVTLHVGMGTFMPVKEEEILKHRMHKEAFFVPTETLELLKTSYQNQNPVFSVGTTSLRVLESIYGKEITPDKYYETDIFLHPGKKVRSVSGLITNFHLPGSTLLMLVSTLIGREKSLELYEIAKKENYRFFSYGDAMLIL